MNKLRNALAWSTVNILKHPFSLMVIVLLIVSALLRLLHVASSQDSYILLFISAVYFGAALFMLLRTRWVEWTILSVGVLLTFSNDGLLYSNAGIGKYYEWPQWYLDYWVVLLRAGFIVGGIWIIIGLTQEWWVDPRSDRLKRRVERILAWKRRRSNSL